MKTHDGRKDDKLRNDLSERSFVRKTAGLSYFLPKTLIKVKLVPIGYPRARVVMELSAQQRADAVERGTIRAHARIDRRTYSVLVDKAGALAQELITGLAMELDEYVPAGGEAGSGEEYKQIADASTYQTLVYRSNALFDDKVCVITNEQSLLERVSAEAKDRTADVLISVAKIIGRIAGPDVFAAATPEDGLTKKPVVVEIDPLNPEDWSSVESAIAIHFPELRGRYVFSVPDYINLTAKLELDDEGKLGKPKCPDGAICYRTLVPVRMVLTGGGKTQVTYARVANRQIMNKVQLTRAFFTEKVTDLDFKEGILTGIKISQDSAALNLAKLPLTLWDSILTAALSAPGEFLDQVTPGMGANKFKELVLDPIKNQTTAVNAIAQNLEDIRNGGTIGATLEKFPISCTK